MSQHMKSQAIQALAPGAQFAITGGVIDWHSPDIPQPSPAEISAKMAELEVSSRIKQLRDAALVSGITVGGLPIHTDDLSQQRITGAAVAAMDDPSMTVNWKAANGSFVTLDAPTILVAARAVRAHVQACYDREAELTAAIAAGDPYDVDAGWP